MTMVKDNPQHRYCHCATAADACKEVDGLQPPVDSASLEVPHVKTIMPLLIIQLTSVSSHYSLGRHALIFKT